MPWTTSAPAVRLRERSHAFDVFAEMMDGWRRHLSGRNASLLAFFFFLSIFPLMLAGVTILGFLLSDDEVLRERIVNSAASEIPVLGETLKDNPESIDGSVLGLVIGLGVALWSSTKAFVGLQGAVDDTWEVDVDDRDALHKLRGKALFGLLIIGSAQIGSFVIAVIVSETKLSAVGDVALIAATLTLNILVIAVLYRYLNSYNPRWREIFAGAIVAGMIFTLLQHFGTVIVKRLAEGENEAMATIRTILGLLTWLSLIGITLIMCAELNAARQRLATQSALRRADELNISLRTSDTTV